MVNRILQYLSNRLQHSLTCLKEREDGIMTDSQRYPKTLFYY